MNTAPDRPTVAEDRPRWTAALQAVTLALGVACARAPVPVGAPAIGAATVSRPAAAPLWVNAFAPSGGDGSAQAPLKSLPSNLAPGTVVHLRAGLYRGPFVLGDGVVLEGHGAVVLYVEDATETVVEATRATLRGLSLQGGAVGLSARGAVTADQVHFGAHRVAGVRAWPSAVVHLHTPVYEAALADARAVQATGAHVYVTHGTFRSAWRRAIDAEDSQVQLDDVRFEGVVGAVHLEGGAARVRGLVATAGLGPAVFIARGRLELADARVDGHEYGLLTGAGAEVSVEGLVVTRPQEGGVALVDTSGTLRHLTLEGTGPTGAVQVLGGGRARRVHLEHCTIRNARALGLVARQADLTVRDLVVDGVRAELNGNGQSSLGDGCHLRESKVEADGLMVNDVDGAAVWASAHTRLVLGSLTSAGAGVGALVVELGAEVRARSVKGEASRGPVVSVLDRGALVLGELTAIGGQSPPLWVECANGASATLGRLVSDREWPMDRCVRRP